MRIKFGCNDIDNQHPTIKKTSSSTSVLFEKKETGKQKTLRVEENTFTLCHIAKSQVFFPSRCNYASCLQVPTNRQEDELNSSSNPLESTLRSSWLCTRPFLTPETPRNGRVWDLSLEEQFNEARPWYNVVRLMNHSMMSFLSGSRTLREDSGNQRCLSGM